VPEALVDDLDAEMEPAELLDCVYGLGPVDEAAFRTLVDAAEPLTVDELAATLDRGRTTAYRAAERRREAGLARRTSRTAEGGGRYHAYRAVDADEAADQMLRRLNDWYAQTGQLIREFRREYGD